MIVNCLLKILNETDVSSPSHAIAKNLLVCIKQGKEINMPLLSTMSGTSKAMVSKFSKQLGYAQFKDLKEDCHFASFPKQDHPSLEHILNKEETRQLEEISQHMVRAHCVYLYGCGYNQILAMQLQYLLLDLNIAVVIMDEFLARQYVIKYQAMLLILNLNKDTSLTMIKKKYADFQVIDMFKKESCSYLMGHVYMEYLAQLVHKL